jgi:hypothetical protein
VARSIERSCEIAERHRDQLVVRARDPLSRGIVARRMLEGAPHRWPWRQRERGRRAPSRSMRVLVTSMVPRIMARVPEQPLWQEAGRFVEGRSSVRNHRAVFEGGATCENLRLGFPTLFTLPCETPP